MTRLMFQLSSDLPRLSINCFKLYVMYYKNNIDQLIFVSGLNVWKILLKFHLLFFYYTTYLKDLDYSYKLFSSILYIYIYIRIQLSYKKIRYLINIKLYANILSIYKLISKPL